MKIVFFGTPEYVIPILESLHKTYNRGLERDLISVVTQDPKPSGRGQSLERSEVDHWAFKHKIPLVFDFEDIPKADLGIVASFGKIIPNEVIKKFSLGLLNVHPSALPEFRGASPVQATLISGARDAHVSIIKMDAQMDHGGIVSHFKDEIKLDDTTESLRDRLFARSADFLEKLIPAYTSGKVKPKPQDEKKATFTKLIHKQDAFVPFGLLKKVINSQKTDPINIKFMDNYNLEATPNNLDRFIKAMHPWPGTWTELKVKDEKKRLKILKVKLKGSKLVLLKVQLEGKKPVSFTQFKQAYPEVFK